MTHKQLYDLYIACGDGIYHYLMDGEGSMQFQDNVLLPKPMYLAIEGQVMYAVLRSPFENCADSGLLSFQIAKDGSLTNAGEIQSTLGEVGCHLCILDGKVYVTNYSSGSVIGMPDQLVRHCGSSVHPLRQREPHPHFICPTPDGEYLCVADLGLDKLFVYDKTLVFVSEVNVPAGHGPRHIVFSKEDSLAYCVNELSSSVSVLRYEKGRLKLLSTHFALPEEFHGESTAAAIRLLGNYLYSSNRGHDSITCFQREGETLKRKSITKCQGRSPRDFNIIGNFLLCANELDNCVTQFKITKDSLQPTNAKLYLEQPICIVYRERGKENDKIIKK